MINPGRSASQSLELQLFEPSPDAIYAIEAVAQMTNVPRHTILVYCRYKLLKRADDTSARTVTTLAGMPFALCVASKHCEAFAATISLASASFSSSQLCWNECD
jgi:hypothetical protein